MNVIEGFFSGKDKHVAIVASRFNSFVVDRLIEGAVDALTRHDVADQNIVLYRIPGAFEFPSVLSRMLQKKSLNYQGIICLGAIIRGETPHFDVVINESSKGIAQCAINSPIPIIFGLLTTETLEQAVNRAGLKSGNKGYEAGMSLLEMMDLYSKI